MFKPAIHTMVWKRPKITKIHFDNISKLNCPVFVGVSESWAVELCKQYGFEYIMTDNLPLGGKKLRTLEIGFNSDRPWTHLIEMGSDSYLNIEAFNKVLNEGFSKDYDMWGVNQSYIISEDGKQAIHLAYRSNRKIKVLGAGRVTKRNILKELHPMWEKRLNSSLDSSSANKFLNAGYKINVVPTPEPVVLAVKSETNIWSFSHLHNAKNNIIKDISVEDALSIVQSDIKNKIKKLKEIN